MTMADRDLSEPQAARILQLSQRTLQRYRSRGLIGFLRTPGGRIRYSVDQLTEFKTRCRVSVVE
jgi:DNA-binding transcriptional MerR regulator